MTSLLTVVSLWTGPVLSLANTPYSELFIVANISRWQLIIKSPRVKVFCRLGCPVTSWHAIVSCVLGYVTARQCLERLATSRHSRVSWVFVYVTAPQSVLSVWLRSRHTRVYWVFVYVTARDSVLNARLLHRARQCLECLATSRHDRVLSVTSRHVWVPDRLNRK